MPRCTEIYNSSCLRCSALNKKMVRIGAFIFCYNCWLHIFGGLNQIEPDSKYYGFYCSWLKQYKKGGSNE